MGQEQFNQGADQMACHTAVMPYVNGLADEQTRILYIFTIVLTHVTTLAHITSSDITTSVILCEGQKSRKQNVNRSLKYM
jgi:hypothetical protein